MKLRSLLWIAIASLAALGCNAEVTVLSAAGDGAGGSVSTSGVGGASSGCAGSPDYCADDCGSDYYPEAQICVAGSWQCPPGTVHPNDCPSGTCWGGPLSCEVCGPNGWVCEPTETCAGSCGGMVCAVCPEDPGTAMVGACLCACTAGGNYSCDLAPSCCNSDTDCGDESYVPCVNNVCKTPVLDACWTDAECAPGQICQGASVCPCGYDCDGVDEPGTCI
jgi:hypothetical protein